MAKAKTALKMPRKIETLGQFMELIMLTRGISNYTLAEQCGFHKSNIDHIKAGKYRYPFEMLKKLRPLLSDEEKALLRELMISSVIKDLEG